MKPMFTPQELAEIEKADAEIERDFSLSWAEIKAAEALDREAVITEKQRRERARKQRWYHRNKEKVSAQKKNYYQENRAARLAYQNAYKKRRKEATE